MWPHGGKAFGIEIHHLHVFWDAVYGEQGAQTLEYERSKAKL